MSSGETDKRKEQEANQFAFELLMPEELLRKDAKGVDFTDDKAVAELANKYKVPVAVMAARLGQLYFTEAKS